MDTNCDICIDYIKELDHLYDISEDHFLNLCKRREDCRQCDINYENILKCRDNKILHEISHNKNIKLN